MKRSRKLTIGVALALLLTAGVAVAAWLVTGSGPGAGKAASAVPLTVEAGTTGVGDLYPGATGGKVYVKVTNPNAFPVQLSSASIAGPVTPTNCQVTASSASFDLSATPVIPAGESADVTLTNALSMGAGADTSCQGIAIAVGGVAVSGASAAQ